MSRMRDHLLITEKSYNVNNIVDDAAMDFWQRVSELVPEAESGDLDPATTATLEKAMVKAVKQWIKYNTFSKK